MPSGYSLAMEQITTVDVRQSGGALGATARPIVPQVVSAARSLSVRSMMVDKRLTHGLLRFPFRESAETRQPRW